MDERKILIDIEISNEDAVKKIVSLKKEVSDLKSQQSQLSQQFKEGKISQDEYFKSIANVESKIRLKNKSLNELQRAYDNSIKVANAAKGSYEQLSAKYSLLKDKINKMSIEERENTDAGRELVAQSKQIYEEMKRLQQVTGNTSLNVGNYTESVTEAIRNEMGWMNSIEGMKAKLAELQKIIEKSDIGSQQFKDASDEASNLRLKIDQALGKVNEFGEKEPKNPAKKAFEDGFAAAGAFASSVELLSVAMSDNENIAALQANSLKAIAVAQNVANIVKEKGAIIDTLTLVKTKALIVAQKLYALAVGQSTGALKVLRVALVSTGIGALIVALGMLIANFKEVTNFITKIRSKFHEFLNTLVGNEQAAKAFAYAIEAIISPITLIISGVNELGKALGFIDAKKVATDIDVLNSVLEKSEKIFEKNNRKLKDNIEILKAKKGDEVKIAEMELEYLKRRANQWSMYEKKVLQHVDNIKNSGRSLTEDEQKALDDFNSKVSDLSVQLAIKQAEIENLKNEKAKEAMKKRKEEQEKLKELELKLQQDFEKGKIELMEKGLKKEIAIIEEETNVQLQELQKQYEEAKKYKDFSLKDEELFRKRRNQIIDLAEKNKLNLIDNYLKEEQQKEKEILENTIKFQKEKLDKKLQIETFVAEKEAKTVEEANKKKLELQLNYYNELLKLVSDKLLTASGAEAEGLKQQIEDITNQINLLKDSLSNNDFTLSKSLGLDEKSLNEIKAGFDILQESINVIGQVFDAAYKTQLASIRNRYEKEEEAIKNSKISAEEKEKKLNELQKKRAKEEYNIAVEQHKVNQALGIANAVILGAQAVLAALSIPDPTFGVLTGIRIGLAVATTAAQIALIAAEPPPEPPQFFEGGFTEKSDNPYNVSKLSNNKRTVHHNEYIVPYKVLKRHDAMPHILALEAMRNQNANYLFTGGYANGGFVNTNMDLSLIKDGIKDGIVEGMNGVNIITRISDIDAVKNKKSNIVKVSQF